MTVSPPSLSDPRGRSHQGRDYGVYPFPDPSGRKLLFTSLTPLQSDRSLYTSETSYPARTKDHPPRVDGGDVGERQDR